MEESQSQSLPLTCADAAAQAAAVHADSPRVARSLDALPHPRGLPLLGNALQIDMPRLHLRLEAWARELGPCYTVRLGPRRILIVGDTALVQEVLRERPEAYRRLSPIEPVFKRTGRARLVLGRGRELEAPAQTGDAGVQHAPPARTVSEYRRGHRAPASALGTSRRARRVGRCAERSDALHGGRHLGGGVRPRPRHARATRIGAAGAPEPHLQCDQSSRECARSVLALLQAAERPRARSLARGGPPAGRRADQRSAQRARCRSRACRSTEDAARGADRRAARRRQRRPPVRRRHLRQPAHLALGGRRHHVQHLGLDAFADARVAPRYEDVAKLRLAAAVAHETLRLRSAAPLHFHESTRDVALGDLAVPAGTPVFLLTRYCGLSESNFEHAERFEPQRWLDHAGEAPGHNPRAALAFGGGPRTCPGRSLALFECAMVISMVARNFRLEPQSGRDTVEERFDFTMAPHGLRVRFHAQS